MTLLRFKLDLNQQDFKKKMLFNKTRQYNIHLLIVLS